MWSAAMASLKTQHAKEIQNLEDQMAKLQVVLNADSAGFKFSIPDPSVKDDNMEDNEVVRGNTCPKNTFSPEATIPPERLQGQNQMNLWEPKIFVRGKPNRISLVR